MPKSYTSPSLVSEVKRRISAPTAQQLFTQSEILEIANDELTNYIFPSLIAAASEYAVTYDDITVEANQSRYDIPARAYNGKLREIHLLFQNPQSLVNLPQLTLEQVAGFGYSGYRWVQGFVVEGNQIILYPTPTAEQVGTLRFYYYAAPNYLVDTIYAGQILTINTGANEITLSNVPTTWNTGTSICVINQNPPFNSKIVSTEILAFSPPTIGIADVSDLRIGDWVCLEGDSTIPQLPAPAFGILAQAAAVKILESMDDKDAIVISQQKLQEIMTKWTDTLSPRIDGQIVKVTGDNGSIGDYGAFPYGMRR